MLESIPSFISVASAEAGGHAASTGYGSTYGVVGSIALFILVFTMITWEKIPHAVTAVLGMVVAFGFGLISFEDGLKSIDMNVIFLLVGMMTSVAILAETGFFEWVAISTAKKLKGDGLMIMLMLLIVTMVFSAFLDNVTTVVLIAPLTIVIAQLLELRVEPLLIMEALASNLGGTATLIGDPPNIIIGSQARISFNDFLFHAAPGIVLASVVFLVAAALLLKNSMKVADSVKAKVADFCPEKAIVEPVKMWISLSIFGLMIVAFALHSLVHLEVGPVAMGGMCLMIILCKSKAEHVLKSVEWDAILFFMGLFVVVAALEVNGVISWMAVKTIALCGGNLLLACMVILWGSAIFSSLLNNIPFVVVMIPMIKGMLPSFGFPPEGQNALYWALAFGVCLGGNGTMVGASANVIVCKIAGKSGYPISFTRFMLWGYPFMILQIAVCMLYIWVRYFLMK